MTKKTRRARLSLQVTPELRAALVAAAKADGRTLSNFVQRALAGAVKGGRS